MNYEILALVAVLGTVIYFGAKPAITFIKSKIGDFNLKNLLENLENIAIALGDDKADKITVPVFAIIIDTLDYAEKIAVDGILDFDDLLEYIYKQLEVFGIYVSEDEDYLIDMVCDMIASYVYNKQ